MGKLLQKNVGTVDRVIRTVLGVAGLAAVFAGPRTAWGWIGVVLLLTAAVGICPLYTALGLRTTGAKAAQPEA